MISCEYGMERPLTARKASSADMRAGSAAAEVAWQRCSSTDEDCGW